MYETSTYTLVKNLWNIKLQTDLSFETSTYSLIYKCLEHQLTDWSKLVNINSQAKLNNLKHELIQICESSDHELIYNWWHVSSEATFSRGNPRDYDYQNRPRIDWSYSIKRFFFFFKSHVPQLASRINVVYLKYLFH